MYPDFTFFITWERLGNVEVPTRVLYRDKVQLPLLVLGIRVVAGEGSRFLCTATQDVEGRRGWTSTYRGRGPY